MLGGAGRAVKVDEERHERLVRGVLRLKWNHLFIQKNTSELLTASTALSHHRCSCCDVNEKDTEVRMGSDRSDQDQYAVHAYRIQSCRLCCSCSRACCERNDGCVKANQINKSFWSFDTVASFEQASRRSNYCCTTESDDVSSGISFDAR